MRILCAPDKFKGTLSALEAAGAMADGARRVAPDAEIDVCPVADGGEGTLAVLAWPLGLEIRTANVTGPLGSRVTASWGISVDRRSAVVELAQAAGLSLVPMAERDPTRTTTVGVGELIRLALDEGCTEIIVALGGSATCDGGAGVAGALGAVFLDADGRPLPAPVVGAALERVAAVRRVELPARLRVACDVASPLLGEQGAASLFAPQKGATEAQVAELERGLSQLSRCVEVIDDGKLHLRPGAGAAGGAGFGLAALCGGQLERGADLVLDAIGFDERCRQADLVLTGEGRLDAQSLFGKAAVRVARRGDRAHVPVAAIAGEVDPQVERLLNVACRGLKGPWSLREEVGEAAFADPAESLRQVSAKVIGQYLIRPSRA
ncbi:MAG: glycerate kinase [Phycisphaerales bacterium]|nr:glycerate kinase [Phycisphaerales bacterium]